MSHDDGFTWDLRGLGLPLGIIEVLRRDGIECLTDLAECGPYLRGYLLTLPGIGDVKASRLEANVQQAMADRLAS